MFKENEGCVHCLSQCLLFIMGVGIAQREFANRNIFSLTISLTKASIYPNTCANYLVDGFD